MNSTPFSDIFYGFEQIFSVNRDLDPVNDVSFIRMRSMKNEILLAPGTVVNESPFTASPLIKQSFSDEDLSLIVIQNPDAAAKQ